MKTSELVACLEEELRRAEAEVVRANSDRDEVNEQRARELELHYDLVRKLRAELADVHIELDRVRTRQSLNPSRAIPHPVE